MGGQACLWSLGVEQLGLAVLVGRGGCPLVGALLLAARRPSRPSGVQWHGPRPRRRQGVSVKEPFVNLEDFVVVAALVLGAGLALLVLGLLQSF